MDVSLIDDIEDEEIIDQELGSEEVIETETTEQMTRDFFTEDSFFIVIYEEEDELIDKLLVVSDLNIDQDKILLKDEEQNDEFLYFDTDDTLIIETESYKINDIEKVEEFTDDITNIDLSVIQDIYPDIEIVVEEVKDKKYSLLEKKESLITELISLYKAYNNDVMIYQITDIVNHVIHMYQSMDDTAIDDSDTLDFVKKMRSEKTYEIPKWILPIIRTKKKIYKTEEEEIINDEDVFIRNFDEEVVEKHRLITGIEDNDYKKIMSILNSYGPFEGYPDGIKIPYEGFYLRDCDEESPCNGFQGPLSFDSNKTKNEFLLPIVKEDKSSSFETIFPKEQLSLLGFYTLPHTFLDISLKSTHLTLHEMYFLGDFKYSYKIFKDRIKKVIPHIIHKDSTNEGETLKENIHTYSLENQDITTEELGSLLKNNLPGYTSILRSIPKHIRNVIYNFEDFKKAYLCYDLDYFLLNKGNRLLVNDMIKQNIKNFVTRYNQSVKRKIIKKVKKKKVILSSKERILLCKEYIMGIHIIPLRNNYMKKFIRTFSREPTKEEDPHFFYEKNSTDKLSL